MNNVAMSLYEIILIVVNCQASTVTMEMEYNHSFANHFMTVTNYAMTMTIMHTHTASHYTLHTMGRSRLHWPMSTHCTTAH